MIDELDINGEAPDLDGKIVQELLVQSYWFDKQLDEEANSVYLKADDIWHRLYFDCGIIFWRCQSEPPEPFEFQEEDGTWFEYPLIDLGRERGLIGLGIEWYAMSAVDGGSQVEIHFNGGRMVGFRCVDDNTKIFQ